MHIGSKCQALKGSTFYYPTTYFNWHCWTVWSPAWCFCITQAVTSSGYIWLVNSTGHGTYSKIQYVTTEQQCWVAFLNPLIMVQSSSYCLQIWNTILPMTLKCGTIRPTKLKDVALFLPQTHGRLWLPMTPTLGHSFSHWLSMGHHSSSTQEPLLGDFFLSLTINFFGIFTTTDTNNMVVFILSLITEAFFF